jgi:hypothetical protein
MNSFVNKKAFTEKETIASDQREVAYIPGLY